MFTIEMDTDSGDGITVTCLDDTGDKDDVEVILYDDDVYIRQIDESDGVQIIIMSYQQLRDIVYAMDLPSGAYYQKLILKGDKK